VGSTSSRHRAPALKKQKNRKNLKNYLKISGRAGFFCFLGSNFLIKISKNKKWPIRECSRNKNNKKDVNTRNFLS